MSDLDSCERRLLEVIAESERQHRKAMEPLYLRLAEIRALRAPAPVYLPEGDAPLGLLIAAGVKVGGE